MKRGTLLPEVILLVLCVCGSARAQETGLPGEKAAPSGPPMPVYVCELSNINDYDIFANSGWDGNWYIGYNVCWIKRLPRIPEGRYIKALIGAKIGRAKTARVPGKSAWDKQAIKGDIYMGVSSTSTWNSNQRHFLVSAEDIPLEGDQENALDGTGEARWFWTEVSLNQVNFDGDNFIALWSPTQYFVTRDTSPILCGGWGVKGSGNTWLNDEIKGSPPIDSANSLKIPIAMFEPAIAMKLIPEDSRQDITVRIEDIKDSGRPAPGKVIAADIYGSQIERSWMEIYDRESGDWKKTGRYVYYPPYIFTLDPAGLPEGKIDMRIACEDVWTNRGYSLPFETRVKAD